MFEMFLIIVRLLYGCPKLQNSHESKDQRNKIKIKLNTQSQIEKNIKILHNIPVVALLNNSLKIKCCYNKQDI